MIKSLFIFVVLFLAKQTFAQNIVGYTFSKEQKTTPFALELNPFTTDGCTKYHNGTDANPDLWLDCCIEHDMKYWLGGTSEERKQADVELYECVKSKGEPRTARIMYLGTRAGGGPLGQNTYRWGFGWNRVRDYKELTSQEREMAVAMYGENLEGLKKGIIENKFPVKVPDSYEYVSPFQYTFCEEEIINYLSPKLSRVATVNKFRDFIIGTTYTIAIGLDVCEEQIEFQFTKDTDAKTCKKDYAYSKQYNKFSDVKISKNCLKRLR